MVENSFLKFLILIKTLFLLNSISDVEARRSFRFKFSSNPVARNREFRNFVNEFNSISSHNRDFAEGNRTFERRINQFSHKSLEDKRRHLNGLRIAKTRIVGRRVPLNFGKGPPELDWRKLGAVTQVKDQGFDCNSCWAYAAIAAIESQYFLQSGELTTFSEQNLIDCNKNANTGNWGCNGGFMGSGFEYVRGNKGLMTQEDYQNGNVQNPCHFNSSHKAVEVEDLVYLPPGDEKTLKNAVATVGPIAVGIDGSSGEFFSYGGGVFNYEGCTSDINHAVVIVGYGTDPDFGDYWLAKNSWGEYWGEAGYLRIVRGKNHCGIANYITYPILKQPSQRENKRENRHEL